MDARTNNSDAPGNDREHLILVKSIFSLSASVPARVLYKARERGRSHYGCKTEMLPNDIS
ncbi:MAG: hypothetical protein EAZ94_06860 [Oscillatoriales cyanobacterium]|nr:MAG: hypothetical protein EAZ94_06860 [Oscillatoriales cyanobacterium]